MQHKKKTKAQQVKENSFGWMINQLASNVRILMKKELKKIDLNQNHFVILMTLLNEQGINQAQICKRTVLPSYAMTRSIDQLEALKLLERKADSKSRRNHLIFLTDKGEKIEQVLFEIVKKVNAEFLSPIDNQEKELLFVILRKLL